MIKTIVFDLDGTLMDTINSIAYFVNYTLSELGFSAIETEKYKYMVGNGRSLLLHRALLYHNADTEENFKNACRIYDNAYEGNFMYLTKPFDGIFEAVAALKERGYKIAVLSNKPDNVTNFIVKEAFGEKLFDHIQGQIEGIPIKPNPESFLNVIKKLGAMPDESIMVGDTNVDIATGKNAKAHTMGVLWGFRTEEELKEAGAEIIIKNPKELIEIFK